MRMPLRLALLATLVAALPLAPVLGQQARPQRLGDFQSWTAAAYGERAQRICYAFARASRAGVLLTVTHLPGSRDEVTVSAGYTYPRNAEATVNVGATELPFYTAGSTAAARDGAAAVRAFRNGREAVLKAPPANGRGTHTDSFPLAGFGAAYDAITRECPRR